MWLVEMKDGRFQYFERYKDPYTEKNKTKSTILTSDSPQAYKKAQKLLAEKIDAELAKKPQQKIKFFVVFDEWFEHHIKSVRPTSIRAYTSHKRIIKSKINEDVLIGNIDTKFLQSFFDTLDYSNQYMTAIKSMLNKMFRYAIKLEYITINPLDNVQIVKKAKTIDDIFRIENKYLESSEAEEIIKELYRRPSTYRLARLAEFMYLTGVRVGEAVILCEDDFDLDNKIVNITGTIDFGSGYKKAIKGPTKTAKGMRKIQLTQRCINLVEKTIDENTLERISKDDYLEGFYLFVTKSGTPIQTNSFNAALKSAGERIGLNEKHLSSHIFRHSHVSLLAEMNIPLKAIMDRVGHSDSDMTNKIYTHVTSNMKTNIINQLEKNGL